MQRKMLGAYKDNTELHKQKEKTFIIKKEIKYKLGQGNIPGTPSKRSD